MIPTHTLLAGLVSISLVQDYSLELSCPSDCTNCMGEFMSK